MSGLLQRLLQQKIPSRALLACFAEQVGWIGAFIAKGFKFLLQLIFLLLRYVRIKEIFPVHTVFLLT